MSPRGALLQLMKIGVLPYGIVARERRPGITILGYHRVGGAGRNEMDLPTELFEWQMDYVRARYRVLSLDEIAALTRRPPEERGSLPPDALAITFDDGYADVFRHAYPVLRRLALPATIYLATAFVEDQRPVPAEAAQSANHDGVPLTWEQAGEMAASGLVTIGAHTHTHLDLSGVSRDAAGDEIAQSNALIAKRLGRPPVHFSYPWGRLSAAAESVVRGVYRTAVVGGTRKNAYAQVDLFRLHRVPVQRSDGRLFFRLKLGSYLLGEEWLRSGPRARRRMRTGPPAETGMAP